MVEDQRIFVEAAPVPCIFKQPFDVSALNVTSQLGVLSKTVFALLTKTVVPALPSRLIRPSIFQAALAVPSEAFCRATIVPLKA